MTHTELLCLGVEQKYIIIKFEYNLSESLPKNMSSLYQQENK